MKKPRRTGTRSSIGLEAITTSEPRGTRTIGGQLRGIKGNMPRTTTDHPRDLPGEHEVDHKTLAQRRGVFRRLNGIDKYPTIEARALAQHMRDLGVFVSKSIRKKRARL